MLRPSVLLPLLILLGLVAAGLLWWAPPADLQTKPQSAPRLSESEGSQNSLLVTPSVASVSGADDPQIAILQSQVQYLEEQVKALRDENSQLVDQLAKLGMKDSGNKVAMRGEAPPTSIPIDFVSLGAEMLADRELQDLPIPTVLASQADVEKLILAWLTRQHADGFGSREGAALASLGVIPKHVDTLPLRAALLVRLIGGWYDDQRSTLYLVDPDEVVDGMRVMSDPVLGIGYGNLLHHYQKSLLRPRGAALTTDERMARLGLLGGDAALQRFLRDLKQFNGPDPSKLPAEDPDHPLNQVPMPAFLRELEIFPLAQGFFFAQALHSLGGFKQLSTSYGRPPESTADVLNTERYLAEQPTPLPQITWPSIKIEGLDPFWDDRLGQYAALAFLKRYNAEETAGDAVKGWLSDRFLAYTIQGDLARRGHAVWQSRWANAGQMDKFFLAMQECITQFYDVKHDPGERLEFSAQGRTLLLQRLRSENSVLLIDAASEAFAGSARSAFGAP